MIALACHGVTGLWRTRSSTGAQLCCCEVFGSPQLGYGDDGPILSRLAKARRMKAVIITLLASASTILGIAAASDQPRCFRHMDGSLRCPQGAISCMADALGKVSCARTDGGIDVDNFGRPMCGPGYCTRDYKGDVFCSKTPGGASTQDIHGKVVCVGGCVPGEAAHCVRPTTE